MFTILLGQMSTIKKLILIKKLFKSGGGTPDVRRSDLVDTGAAGYMKLKS